MLSFFVRGMLLMQVFVVDCRRHRCHHHHRRSHCRRRRRRRRRHGRRRIRHCRMRHPLPRRCHLHHRGQSSFSY